MIFVNGLGVLWPKTLVNVVLADGQRLLGERLETTVNPDTGTESVKFKVGNAEDGPAFVWVDKAAIRQQSLPVDAFVLERTANMNYHGFLRELATPGFDAPAQTFPAGAAPGGDCRRTEQHDRVVKPVQAKQSAVANQLKNDVKYQILHVTYERKQLLAAGTPPTRARSTSR